MHAEDQSASIARLLSRAIGGCQAAGAAVLIYRRPPEERQNRHDRVAPFQRVPPLQLRRGARPPQHHCVEPLAAAVAVRRRLERLAAADWRQRLQVTDKGDLNKGFPGDLSRLYKHRAGRAGLMCYRHANSIRLRNLRYSKGDSSLKQHIMGASTECGIQDLCIQVDPGFRVSGLTLT